MGFIIKYLGTDNIDLDFDKKKPIDDGKDANKDKPNGIDSDEYDFVNLIWDELKTYFDLYDKGSKGYLNLEELKLFAVEVLQENTQTEMDYVLWNLFRVDPNSDCSIEFLEFAPFILKHAS